MQRPRGALLAEHAGRWWPAAAAAAIGVTATLILTLQPLGAREAGTAALDAVEASAAPGSATVLAEQPWGDGTIVLAGFDDRSRARHLSLAFVVDHGRGWRVAGRTENQVDVTDVVVGSLLVASSPGGSGQPAWSAVYGEVGDDRIGRVEVQWDDDQRTTSDVTGVAYMAVRGGEHTPTLVRYLGEADDEIAVVPVGDA